MIRCFCFRSGLLLALVFSPQDFCLSQNSGLYGEIVNNSTLEAVPFANVVVKGEPYGTAANEKGFYSLNKLLPGPCTIAVSAVGFVSRETTLTVSSQVSRRVDFRLVPEPVKFGEVVVTGRSLEPISPPLAGVRHIEQAQMKAVPVPVQRDALQSLLVLPGIISTSDVNSRFYVRGGGGDQNQIMLDGMRLYSPFHALGMYSVFDPELIRSADVYTGAFPAGYGGRLSSIVSLMTAEPRADKFTGGGDVNFLSSRIGLEGPLSPSSRFFVSVRKSLFPETFKRLSGIDRTFSFYDVLAKANADIIGVNSLAALVLLTGDDLPSEESNSATYRWRNQLVGLSAHGLVADRMYLMASLYVSRYWASREPNPQSSIPRTSTGITQPGLRIDASLYGETPDDITNFGIESVFPRPTDRLVNTSGATLMYASPADEISIWFRKQSELAGIKMDAGLRLQIMNAVMMGWEGVEPRLHLSRVIWNDWALRLAYGRISQSMVTANNEDDLIPIFDAWIALPQGIPSEFADHYVIGLDGPLSKDISLGFQGYRKLYRDLVLYNRGKITARDPDFLAGSGTSEGIETLLRFSGEPLDVSCAYTFSRTNVSSGGFSYAPRYDIRHAVNVLALFRLLEGLDLSLRWEFKSGMPFTQTIGFYNRIRLNDPIFDPFENDPGVPYGILGAKNAARMPSYHRLDMSARYRRYLGALLVEIGGSVVNVYNRKNIFYFERETGRRVDMLPIFPSVYLSVML